MQCTMTTTKPTITRFVIRPASFVLFLVVALISYILIGQELERRAWLLEQDPAGIGTTTLFLYTTNETCTASSGHVLHCGVCGACSNPHDINIFEQTSQTLTTIMADCTTYGFLAGAYQDSSADRIMRCLHQRSNLTLPCAKCWTSNALCTKRHCMRTCIRERFFPFLPSSLYNDDKWVQDHPHLSPCLACDEHFCGPEFLTCAGANRRRVGIVSDLQRHEEVELCDKTDWDYVRRMSHDSSSPPAVAPQPNPSSPQNHHHEDL